MFSNFFLKSFRLLLFPFAFLYWLGIGVRNWLYDKKILSSASFGLPLICVGNLAVGGTGKSPMVEYLVEMLKDKFNVATLSRGYKRKTRGYSLAGTNTTALDIGDEPMQFHLKFPGVPVAVGEERIEAIPQLLHDRPETEAIILDDAFQHRRIKAGLNILLTDYNNLFTRDFYLPTGDLRDLKASYKRAEIIVVTKCPPDLSEFERDKLVKELHLYPNQQIYFTSIEYGKCFHLVSNESLELKKSSEILLVTGIANPKPLKKMLEEHSNGYHMLQYADHHIFTIDDLKEIRHKFEMIKAEDKIILTTEKDAVRLHKFNNEIAGIPFYVIPVRHRFLFGGDGAFEKQVVDFITHFNSQS
jgi:tetraacyldisaccharide 4'-kinase